MAYTKEQHAKYNREYRQSHEEYRLSDNLRRMEYATDHRKAENKRINVWHHKVRNRVIDALGGKCDCCGETSREFLTIHHINNDGAQHRRQKLGRTVYRDIELQGYPKDKYQVLCFNCNCSIGFSGQCPHSNESFSIAGLEC